MNRNWIISITILLLTIVVSAEATNQKIAVKIKNRSCTICPLDRERPVVPHILPEELKRRMDRGEPVAVIDVRSLSAYKRQHISGAISIPFKQIKAEVDKFPCNRDIVFY
jgi:3-mercaptopyruvate sulfurtransferase SseA